MKNPYKARINERHFLNLPGFHAQATVVAYIEDTKEREIDLDEKSYSSSYNFASRMILTISDCSREIYLEFDIHSAEQRMNSFHKIDTLIETLEQFKEGMDQESKLFKARKKEIEELEEQKKAADKKQSHKAHHRT